MKHPLNLRTEYIRFAFYLLLTISVIIVAALVWIITSQKIDEKLISLDNSQVEFAEHQASIEYQKNYKPFTAVFDTETKQFVDKRTARMSVKPYGSSKEHQGMYLLITVDKDGNISSQWISP